MVGPGSKPSGITGATTPAMSLPSCVSTTPQAWNSMGVAPSFLR